MYVRAEVHRKETELHHTGTILDRGISVWCTKTFVCRCVQECKYGFEGMYGWLMPLDTYTYILLYRYNRSRTRSIGMECI